MNGAATPKTKGALAALLLLAAAAIAGWRIAPYTPAYRERAFRTMSLSELLQQRARYVNDPIFLYYLGADLDRAGEYAAADPILERAAGLDPHSARIRDEWAQALLGHGRVSIAFGILKQYLATHPNAAQPQLLLGKFYMTREDWEQAASALQAAARLDPGSGEADSLLAQTQIKMGQYGAAQDSLSRALKLRPGSAYDHLQLAVLIGDIDPARARSEYVRSVQLAPRDAICQRQYGRFLLGHGDPAGAEHAARSALASNPQDPHALLLLGRALAAQSRLTEAATWLQQAASAAPTDPEPADELRRTLRAAGDPDQAALWSARYLALVRADQTRRRLSDAAQAHPKDPVIHRRYAAALAAEGDVNGCVREEAFAARTPPDNARPLALAARDLDAAGYTAQALPLARQAADQRKSPDGQEALATVLLHLGRLHEAAVLFDQCANWNPARRALYRQEIAGEAARIAASQAPAERLLRQAASQTDPARAERLLTEAVRIDPQNTRCLRALMKAQFDGREADLFTATAAHLAGLSPEDGVAQTYYVAGRLMALPEGRLNDTDYRELDGHLRAAERDAAAVPLLCYDRGVLELGHGDAHTAVAYLEKARSLDPRSPAVYRELAMARSHAGDAAGASAAMSHFESMQRR